MKYYFVLVLSLLILGIFCSAQPGFPDNSFGTGGITHTNINEANQLQLRAQTMVSLSSNKFALAAIADGVHCIVVQFLTNGKIDSTFANNGQLYIENFIPGEIAVQNDGKLLVAGYSAVGNGKEHMIIVRLHADGRYDQSFSNTGRLDFSLTAQNNALTTLAIQTNGKIVAAGYAELNGNYDFAAVRLNENGTFDDSFNGDGKVITPVGTINDYASSVCIQNDGKIVLGGSAGVGSYWNFGVVRYTSTGGLDNDFNGNGKLILEMSATNDEISSIALQQDQKILLGGYASNGSNSDFSLVRLTTSGIPDNEFDGDGKLITPVGSSEDNLRKLSVQTDGKIVAFGYSLSNTYDYVILRYTSIGQLDTDFDIDGKVMASHSNYQDLCLAGFIQNDNKIVAGGYSFLGTISDISVFRFNSVGAPDNSFDDDGKATIHQGKSTDYAIGMAAQSDGKLVTGGYTYIQNSPFKDAALVRYKTNGKLDETFGTGGKVITAISSSSDVINAVAIQPDGKILTAGYAVVSGYRHFFIARYNELGILDNEFDGDGKLIINLSATGDEAFALVIQPDNKILVGGYLHNGSNRDFALIRLMPNGTTDNSFDGDGIVTTQFGTGNESIMTLALNADETIVAAGTSVINFNDDFAIARYNSNGSLDNSFDGDGKLTLDISPGNNDRAEYLTIQTDGKMVVVGSSYVSSTYDFALVRINTNGTLDDSFSNDGKLTIDVGISFGTFDGLTGAAVQHDGKIVISGVMSVSPGFEQFHTVARLTAGGLLDNSFGINGISIITPIKSYTSSSEASSRNIVLTNDRVYIAGTTSLVSDDFAIMALHLDNAPLSMAIYRFIGNGNFNNPANWENNLVPPNPLPNGAEIFINPAGTGQCLLNTTYSVSAGGKFTVVTGKILVIDGSLIISGE